MGIVHRVFEFFLCLEQCLYVMMNQGTLHINFYCDFLILILLWMDRLKGNHSLCAVVTDFRTWIHIAVYFRMWLVCVGARTENA
jgi:hypothetical protein